MCFTKTNKKNVIIQHNSRMEMKIGKKTHDPIESNPTFKPLNIEFRWKMWLHFLHGYTF